MARYIRSNLGLFVPVPDEPIMPTVPSAEVYISSQDLGIEAVSESKLVDELRQMAVADCLIAIAHISTRIFAETRPRESDKRQHELVIQMLGELAPRVLQRLARGVPTTVFCEQQLVHLARLVILECDRRSKDDFAGGSLREQWGRCLVGVNDLLDAGLNVGDDGERLAWEIRQCALNHHEDQLPTSALHYEVYRVIWPELKKGRYENVEAAFRRHTGITIGDYFAVGSAVLARLVNRGASQPTVLPAITPGEYFASGEIEEATWRAFFALVARDVDALRGELLGESAELGQSTYGSLTFERYPLAEVEEGVYVPVSMHSLQRRLFGGVFHLLSEAAEEEGKDRRTYSSRFGRAFQRSVEDTLRRGSAFSDPVSIVADQPYGPRTNRRDSSDVILGYPRNPTFVEVVSGPLQARTITQGDAESFLADANRLVVEKARQLDQCITAFFDGDFELPGVDPVTIERVWPIIVSSHLFPHVPRVIQKIDDLVREAGHLQGPRVGGLAIVSAEELFFCEGFMQQGRTFLSLVLGWKSGPYKDFSFKNHLIAEGKGRAPSSDHFERRFAELSVENMNRVSGSKHDISTALDLMRQGRP